MDNNSQIPSKVHAFLFFFFNIKTSSFSLHYLCWCYICTAAPGKENRHIYSPALVSEIDREKRESSFEQTSILLLDTSLVLVDYVGITSSLWTTILTSSAQSQLSMGKSFLTHTTHHHNHQKINNISNSPRWQCPDTERTPSSSSSVCCVLEYPRTLSTTISLCTRVRSGRRNLISSSVITMFSILRIH